MKQHGWIQVALLICGALLWTGEAGVSMQLALASDRSRVPYGGGPTVTVQPAEIEDILFNPGMGFADFHFGWGKAPDPSQYPRQTVAYFRWPWADLEPIEGQYNFALVDHVIEQAKAKGESLAFRIVTDYDTGSPPWLLAKGVAAIQVRGSIFPDYNNSIFLDYHERLIRAFGARYAGSPNIDHVDIGSVGCWGEWNTACCGVDAHCDKYYPTYANQLAITNTYFRYFPNTPLVMLVGGPVKYAVSRGAGWRGDCFGDYGMVFGSRWNHMEHIYGPTAADPVVGGAWKIAPVQFEVCGVMQDWYDRGFDVDLILRKGLEWHMSILNAKSSPVPVAWRARVDEFLKKLGYRMILREMTHTAQASPGGTMLLRSKWENKGVAPIYHFWPLAYRLRSNSNKVVAQWRSTADLRRWLPGALHDVTDTVRVPEHVPPETYSLDVGILTEDSSSAHVDLAIEGKRKDRWYPVSKVTIRH